PVLRGGLAVDPGAGGLGVAAVVAALPEGPGGLLEGVPVLLQERVRGGGLRHAVSLTTVGGCRPGQPVAPPTRWPSPPGRHRRGWRRGPWPCCRSPRHGWTP